MMFENTEVLSHTTLGADYRRLAIRCDRSYQTAVPGQFVMARLPGRQTPLLSRPFSIHRLRHANGLFQGIEILYKIVGPATRDLAGLKPGDRISLLGPLGRGFSPPPLDGPFWLVAGGIGVAPLVFFAEWLHQQGTEPALARVFLGGRSAADVLCAEVFERKGMAVDIASDDGGLGVRGPVTDSLTRALGDARPAMMYACGPEPMLRAVADIARRHGLPCEISIETVMACGMGACLGCAVAPKEHGAGRFLHACLDGPVFSIDTILTDARHPDARLP